MQNPSAKYVAGINGWKKLTGLNIKNDAVPILILYPSINQKELSYSIQKVFDYTSLDNENVSLINIENEFVFKCNKSHLFYGLSNYLEENKYSLYPDKTLGKSVKIDSHNIITYGEDLSFDEKIVKILEIYLKTKTSEFNDIVSGSIVNSTIYIIGKYYGLDVSRLNFKYISLPIITEENKKTILMQTISLSSQITESIDCYSYKNSKERSR